MKAVLWFWQPLWKCVWFLFMCCYLRTPESLLCAMMLWSSRESDSLAQDLHRMFGCNQSLSTHTYSGKDIYHFQNRLVGLRPLLPVCLSEGVNLWTKEAATPVVELSGFCSFYAFDLQWHIRTKDACESSTLFVLSPHLRWARKWGIWHFPCRSLSDI